MGGYHLEGEQPQHDAERTKRLEKDGYTVVRFTNEEVLTKTDEVIEKIKVAIKEHTD